MVLDQNYINNTFKFVVSNMTKVNNNLNAKIVQKALESHWILSPRGTVRDSSGPSVPSCTGARPKNEQNLIHSELKAVPDRFTPYSRFREIYNGKRSYRICAWDVSKM